MIVREVPGDGADRSRQGALLPVEKKKRFEQERCPTSFFASFFLMAA